MLIAVQLSRHIEKIRLTKGAVKLMKKMISCMIGLALGIAIMGVFFEVVWRRYSPPQTVGAQMGDSGKELGDVSGEWFESYVESLMGWEVPYDYRVKKARLDSVQMLEEHYVQLDYTVWPVSSNDGIVSNLELAGTDVRGIYKAQMVLHWEDRDGIWTIVDKMRPVQYQLQSPGMQEELQRPQTEHYKLKDGAKMTYYVEDGILYVTYDAGATFIEVPDGYEKIIKDINGTYNELLPFNSYVITPEFTAFAAYTEGNTSLIYSTDSGMTWQESKVYDGGYKASTFLSRTENRCYITFAVDRALGSDYYATFQSEDMVTWNQVSMDQAFAVNLSCSYWSGDMTGYYSGGEGSFYMTQDGAETYQQVQYDAPREITDELGFQPFDTMEKMYQENGVIYMVVGQGDDGDYVKDGELMKALYQSQDGVNFQFAEEIADTPEQAG